MSNYCENCGCKVYSGRCTNCHEELYILDQYYEQYMELPDENSDNMREANFNAWKEKHDREVKKCVCETPNPRPTDKNNCWDCNGEIYKEYLDKVRWKEKV